MLSMALATVILAGPVTQALAEERALVIARDMDVNALDPARAWCDTCQIYNTSVYEQLVTLDKDNKVVPPDAADKFKRAVHLKDIHIEKGMHCIDCHFSQDNHGNGKLYGETRNAVEIDCRDCHGTIDAKASGGLPPITSG